MNSSTYTTQAISAQNRIRELQIVAAPPLKTPALTVVIVDMANG
jgi:hypothetical protein